ncbi:multidrug effflux MFS transporter [Psychromonas sp. MME2]|uniref:multidrug effflux MFS transporter n=1 Tax=Psychromonas sp. MME2 TaxID=3231033 RepID=UPI00339C17E8
MSNSKFALIMALIVAATPFAIDAYLPAIPYMADFFTVSSEQIATTISLYVLGLATGQLVGGPLADNYGKRHLILVGLLLFAACSLIIALTHSLLVVQVSRVIQAIGGGFAMVCIAPLVRERATGNEAAKLFSLIGLIIVVAPIAPSVGVLLIYLFGWQSIFFFLFIYALFVVSISHFKLAKDASSKTANTSFLRRYRLVVANREGMRYLVAQGCSFSVMLVFVTNASFIYQKYFALSDALFALLFSANVIMMAIFNRYNNFRLNHISAMTLLQQGLWIQLTGLCLLVLMVIFNAPVAAVAINIIFIIGAQGAISANSNAVYISHFHEHTGSASALCGASQFLMAALAGGLSTLLYNGTLWPAVLVMLGLSLIANGLLLTRPNNSGNE